MNLQWQSPEHRSLEWKIANQHLIINGELSQDGTTLAHRTIDEPVSFRNPDTGMFIGLEHSFMVLDGKILALSNKTISGLGLCDVVFAEDEVGDRYAVKRELFCKKTSNEAHVAYDLGIAGSAVEKKPENSDFTFRYLPYRYLGTPLHTYLANTPLTEDQRYVLCIKLAQILDGLHSGKQSNTNQSYAHGDIQYANITVDDNNDPHLIDFEITKPIKDGTSINGDLCEMKRILDFVMHFEHGRNDSPLPMIEYPANNTPVSKTLFQATSAFDIARQLTIMRCHLAQEYHAHLSPEGIRVINALHTNRVPF